MAIIQARFTSPRNSSIFTTTTNSRMNVNLTGEIVHAEGMVYGHRQGSTDVSAMIVGKRITLGFLNESDYQSWLETCQSWRRANKAALQGNNSIICIIDLEFPPSLPSGPSGVFYVEDALTACTFDFKAPSNVKYEDENAILAALGLDTYVADKIAYASEADKVATTSANNAPTLRQIKLNDKSKAGMP
jgi:hypothetical protein